MLPAGPTKGAVAWLTPLSRQRAANAEPFAAWRCGRSACGRRTKDSRLVSVLGRRRFRRLLCLFHVFAARHLLGHVLATGAHGLSRERGARTQDGHKEGGGGGSCCQLHASTSSSCGRPNGLNWPSFAADMALICGGSECSRPRSAGSRLPAGLAPPPLCSAGQRRAARVRVASADYASGKFRYAAGARNNPVSKLRRYRCRRALEWRYLVSGVGHTLAVSP